VTRGISVPNAAPSTQGVPSVDPVYTWVCLAQRVPMRVRITNVPPGVPLVSGMTVTVTIRDAEARKDGGWLHQRFAYLVNRLHDVVTVRKRHPTACRASAKKRLDRNPSHTESHRTARELAPGIADSPRVRF
jgi:hypothetical protein